MEKIQAKTVGEAWTKVCRLILKKGKIVKDGNQILREIINVFIEIKKPTLSDSVFEKFANVKEMEWMRRLWLGKKSIPAMGRFPKYKVSYGKLIFDLDGENQLDWIIKKLKENPETKSATISILKPGEKRKSHIPCSPVLDFKIRNKKLFLIAFFRSQDAYKKLHFDIYFLGKIAQMVAEKIKIPCGPLCFFVASEHIYEEDLKEIKKLIKFQFKSKKIKNAEVGKWVKKFK